MSYTPEKIIAIGDIHGCFHELLALLHSLDLKGDEHLVFMGDYIDRGPDSKKVINLLRTLSGKMRCTFLRGNHEAMMLDAISKSRESVNLWLANGGEATLASYGYRKGVGLPEDHVEWIRATQLYYETEEFFFVHAGLNPRLSVHRQSKHPNEHVFLWTRDHMAPSADLSKWEKTVVCGHTIQEAPINKDRLICIDTGAFLSYWPGRSGHLTAVRLPEREFLQVDRRTAASAAVMEEAAP